MRLSKKRPTGDRQDSFGLPRFSFESESEQHLISTERLFLELSETGTSYDPGLRLVRGDDSDQEEIIVCLSHHFGSSTNSYVGYFRWSQ